MAAGIAARFAGNALYARLAPLVKKAAPYAFPFLGEQAPTLRNVGRAAALSAIPDVLFAGMTAASLPEGTPWHQRLGAGVMDAGLGFATGAVGAGGLGYGLRKAGLPPGAAQVTQMIGEPLMYPAVTMAIPNTFANDAWQGAQQRQIQQEAERRKLEDQRLVAQTEQSLLDSLFGGWQ